MPRGKIWRVSHPHAPIAEILTSGDVIRVPAVEARLLKNNVGYLKIKQFSQTTDRDMRRKLDELIPASFAISLIVVR